MVELLGHGIYTISEAARLLRLRAGRVSEWFNTTRQSKLFRSDYADLQKRAALSFLDLIDALVATKLRAQGVSLQIVRKAYKEMAAELKTAHPFCHKELLTDGKDIFVRSFAGGEEQIAGAIDRQKLFPKIILPYLKQLDYDTSSRLALRWNIKDEICIDPKICLGKPIVRKVGIPTRVLAEEYKANGGDAKLVAMWYNVSAHDVRAAHDFERNLAA